MTMFDDIASAIGTALGADKTTGGLIAGAIFTIILIVILEWTIGDEEKSGTIFLISTGLGVVLSTAFGWFDKWIAFVMGIVLVFIMVNPFSDRSNSAG